MHTGMINVVHLYAYMYGRWYMSSTICMLYIICMCTCTYGCTHVVYIYTFINNMCVHVLCTVHTRVYSTHIHYY